MVLFGAGTATVGIAEQLRDAMMHDGLTPREAAERIWAVDRHRLLSRGPAGAAGTPDALRPQPRRGGRLARTSAALGRGRRPGTCEAS
ncbi:malic enzyme-like NAD(P)-binding protein [Streptomyces purpurascens]